MANETLRSPKVTAAAKVIHAAGLHHGWFGPEYKKSYEELDPIGREEFDAIVEEALLAASSASDGILVI